MGRNEIKFRESVMTRDTVRTSSLIKTFILAGLIAMNGSAPAGAQDGTGDTEEKKIAVAKAFCGDHGLLTKCIGQAPESCTSAMKPLIDTCYEKKDFKLGETAPESEEEGFKNCFWAEYLKRFSSRIQYTEECTGSTEGKLPIEPLPPHLEAQTQLLNPPGEKTADKGGSGF
jgi:predicted secreted protein